MVIIGEQVQAGVGASEAKDAEEAATEAISSAFQDFEEDGGESPDFCMVFTNGSNFGGKRKKLQSFVETIDGELPEEVDWIGGTSAGEIINGEFQEKSTVVLLLSSEYIDFGVGKYEPVRESPREAGKEAVSSALENLGTDEYLNPYLKYLASKQKASAKSFSTYEYFVMVLSPGLTLKGPGREDKIVNGIFDVTGKRVPVIGGATVHPALKDNYQFHNGELHEDAVIVVTASTGLKIGFSFDHGYQPSDKQGICTKCEGYIISEIDGEPALERYADMMETTPGELWDTKSKVMDKSSGIVSRLSDVFSSVDMDPTDVPFLARVFANPLGVPDPQGNYSLKTPFRSKRGELQLNQEIPENVAVNMMEVDEDSILEAEANSIRQAMEDSGGEPDVILLFDCALRKFYLGEERLEEVIGEMREEFPDSKIIGFNTGGEYGFRKDSAPVSTCLSSSVGVISDELITD